MLGLGRPSLKSRPSLIDLIFAKDQARSRPSTPIAVGLPEDPPTLPANVSSNHHHHHHHLHHHHNHTSNGTPAPLSPPLPPPTMPPKSSKRTRPEADDEQHGSIYSVSGPVVVAENMIGCAMYELVGANYVYVLYLKRKSSAWTFL